MVLVRNRLLLFLDIKWPKGEGKEKEKEKKKKES